MSPRLARRRAVELSSQVEPSSATRTGSLAKASAAGHVPETEAYTYCVERAAYYRDAQREYRSLAGPSVRCTAGSNAGGCF